MTTNKIYFLTKNGNLVTNLEISKMAHIVSGNVIDADDLKNIRKYATNCKGIVKEINPSIRVCLQRGDKYMAIKLYYDRHPGATIRESKDAVEKMIEKMNKKTA